MIKLAITGYPLAHSLSPAMHRAALAAVGLEGDYVVLEAAPDELEAKVNYLKENGFRGFNVTIPHKVAIMNFLDEIDPFAKQVGAVNTVIISPDKKLSGYNTDVYGFTQAIPADIRESLHGKKAAVIGSGGAARAVLAGLADIGISEITIHARNTEKAQELATSRVGKFCPPESTTKILVAGLNDNTNLSGVSIVVNTTPVGMHGKFEGESPLSEASITSLPQDALVYDLVYKPAKTKLLEIAEKRELLTLNGLDMLVLQGAKGLSLWTGLPAPVGVMKQALLATMLQ
jgi:shikimate dehydrogenase